MIRTAAPATVPPSLTEAPTSWQRRLAPLLLCLAIFAGFASALRNGFVLHDDPSYVTNNYHVQHGLTWDGIVWAFSTTHTGNWIPLTWLSHMLDVQLFGLAPWGHHLTAVLLHAFNATLLFLLLRRMTAAFWRSLLVAALFALHPLRVESVAWVSERKDVLNIAFGLVAMWCYVEWSQRTAAGRACRSRYWLAVVCFALALLAKPMLVTLPFLLLLLDYWPLGRFDRIGRRMLEKLPFLAIAAAASVRALYAQQSVGAIASDPLLDRAGNAAVSYVKYIGKTLYPVDLTIVYPPAPLAIRWVLLAVLCLLGLLIAAYCLRRKAPHVWVGWTWFLGTMLPVCGLIQLGSQAMADRYTYWPSIGLLIAAVWGTAQLSSPWRHRTPIRIALVVGCLGVCTVLTTHQIGFWYDNESLFRHALVASHGRSWVAYDNLGMVLGERPEQFEEARQCYENALRLAPEASDLHLHYANLLASRPETNAEAIREFHEALALRSDNVEAHLFLATTLARTPASLTAAIAEFRRVLELNPARSNTNIDIDARLGLGQALLRSGRPAEAADELQRMLATYPNRATAAYYLGTALTQIPGRAEETIAAFRHALRLEPNLVEAHFNLGTYLGNELGRSAEAIPEYEAVIRARPDLAIAHARLGLCLATIPERHAEAIQQLETALRLDPRLAEARRALDRLR